MYQIKLSIGAMLGNSKALLTYYEIIKKYRTKNRQPGIYDKIHFFRFKDAEKMVYAKIKIKQSLRPNVIIGEIMGHTVH